MAGNTVQSRGESYMTEPPMTSAQRIFLGYCELLQESNRSSARMKLLLSSPRLLQSLPSESRRYFLRLLGYTFITQSKLSALSIISQGLSSRERWTLSKSKLLSAGYLIFSAFSGLKPPKKAK